MNERDCLAAALTLLAQHNVLNLDDVLREGKKGFDDLFILIASEFKGASDEIKKELVANGK